MIPTRTHDSTNISESLESIQIKATQVLQKSPLSALVLTLSSITARFFVPAVAPPLLAMGVTLFATKAALEFTDLKMNKNVRSLMNASCELHEKLPYLHIISLVGVVALGFFSSYLSFSLGIAYGAWQAVLIQRNKDTILNLELK